MGRISGPAEKIPEDVRASKLGRSLHDIDSAVLDGEMARSALSRSKRSRGIVLAARHQRAVCCIYGRGTPTTRSEP